MSGADTLRPEDFLFPASGESRDSLSIESLNLEEIEKKVIQKALERHSGNVSQVAPTTSGRIAIGPEKILIHSKEFAEASISEAGKHGLLVGAKAMTLSCIDLLTNPKLLEEVKAEFQKT